MSDSQGNSKVLDRFRSYSDADPVYVDLVDAFPYLNKNTGLTNDLLQGLDHVEQELYGAISHTDSLADVTGRHLAEAGGKRLRPLLALLAAQYGDGITPDVVVAATVVELTHLATLYHDDVMDSAPLRRGIRTVHEIWGNSVAILTGDLIFARAATLGSGLGPEAIRIHARTFERLCLGQLHETVGFQKGEDPLAHYVSVVSDKTGSLLAASVHLGALVSGAPPYAIDCLLTYGEKVGVAFQLADDIIDIIGGDGTSGKIAGTDLRKGVPTLPVLLARKAAREGDVQAQEAISLIDSDLSADEDLERAVTALRALPVMDEAQKIAEQWAQEGVAALEPLGRSEVKDALVALVGGITSRTF